MALLQGTEGTRTYKLSSQNILDLSQAHLASIHSKAENLFLALKVVPNERQKFWLDGRRLFPDTKEEFGWTDGTSWDYQTLCPTQTSR